ncbi:glutamic acid-rich protein-like isoform X2 [Patiria miniata]|nr:glutamic acid-rich protein-like isoform X2 [Patiria miniata]XP_038047269.1 glutamic acid-rich protein-like isoform X2 [Patiria miniata]
METDDEAQMEGYLQKRFRSGMVKTLKKKWCVLKDGEIRWYQNKEVSHQNAEMYQDILPVSRVQTVRSADNHGVEVVTQQHIYILVASCEEDQKKWIKAIYEAMKDKRPRSVSNPEEGSKDADVKRKRSSTGPKVSISRILTGFHRKSTTDNQPGQGQAQFYLEHQSQQPSFAEIGVQADVQKAPKCTRVEEGEEGEPEEEVLADDVLERQDATSQPSASVSPQQKTDGDKSVKGERSSSTNMDQESSLHLGSDLLPDDARVSGNHVQSGSDSEEEVSPEAPLDSGDPKQEDGMHELELMLRKSVSSENGYENSKEVFGSDVDDDVDDDDDGDVGDDKDDEDLEDYDIDDETPDGNLNKKQDGISAFEQLEALLQNF